MRSLLIKLNLCLHVALVVGGLLWGSLAYAEVTNEQVSLAVSEVVIQTVAMESASEPFEGQVAVASVIINRARRAGKSLEWAVLRPKQFSCWNSPKWAKEWCYSHFSNSTAKRARNALKMASTPEFQKFNRLSHYHRTDIKPYWAVGHVPAFVIGNHAFYNDVK